MRLRHILSIVIPLAIILGSIGYANASENYGGKIYVIGTSITCGHNGTGDYGHDPDPSYYTHNIITHQYPYWLDYYMNHTYDIFTNVSSQYSNCSWDKYDLGAGGGYTPVDIMDDRLQGSDAWFNSNREPWRLPNPDDIDILIVEGGHHDLNSQGNTAQQLDADIYALYNFTHAHGIKMILCTMTPDYRSSMHEAENITNEWRRNFAANHSDVWLADIFNSNLTQWNAGHTDWSVNTSFFSDSGTHPNEAGYKEMARVISATLNEVISPSTSYTELDSATFGANLSVLPKHYAVLASATFGASLSIASQAVTTYNALASAVFGANLSVENITGGSGIIPGSNFPVVYIVLISLSLLFVPLIIIVKGGIR